MNDYTGNNKIDMYKGDDQIFLLSFKNDDGTPLDITDYTIYFTVKRKKTDADSDSLIQKVITSHSNAVQGSTGIQLDHADTVDIKAGDYFFDIQVKDSGGKITTYVADTFTLAQDITQGIE